MYKLTSAQSYHDTAESLSDLFASLAVNVKQFEDNTSFTGVVSVDVSYLRLQDEPDLWTATVVVE